MLATELWHQITAFQRTRRDISARAPSAPKAVVEVVAAPSRRVVTRSRMRPTGKYPSWKLGRTLEWEFIAERNAYRILDAMPFVRDFQERPAAVRWTEDGQVHTWLPQLLIVTSQFKALCEIRSAMTDQSMEALRRSRLLEAALPAQGYHYCVLWSDALVREPRQTNIVEILRHGRGPVPPRERETLRRYFSRVQFLYWGEVRRGELGPRGRAYVCRLILEGAIACDIERRLGDDTRLYWIAADLTGDA